MLLGALAALVLALTNTACSPEGICKNGNGVLQSDTLSLPSFGSIKLVDAATVHVSQGKSQEVIVEGDENVLEAMNIRVENGELIVDVEGCFFSYDFDVYVQVPQGQPLSRLAVSGSGEIMGEDSLFLAQDFVGKVSGSGEIKLTAANVISSTSFDISGSGKMEMDFESSRTRSNISGSGKLFLIGKTQDHQSRISGSGDVKAFDLSSQNTEISVSGSGDGEITVEGGVLEVSISGSGDVHYKGSPSAVNSSISGSGDLRKVN